MIVVRSLRFEMVNKKVLIIPGMLLIAGLFTGIPVYWVLFWFAFFWLILAFIWLVYIGRNLDIFMELDSSTVERTRNTGLKIRLFNDTFLPFPYGQLIFPAQQSWDSHNYKLFLDDAEIDKYLEVSDINPLSGWQRWISVQCYRRGKFFLGPLKVRMSSPFGILALERDFQETKSILVYPRILSLAGTPDTGGSEPQGTMRKQNIMFSPMDYTEVPDLRPFVSGDPPKLINWKVSARQSELYIKRVENTGDKKVMICIEFSEKFYNSTEKQDLMLEKALSLIKYFVEQNIQTGVLTLDHEIKYLAPASGRRQLQLARKMLTYLEPGGKVELLKHFLNTSWLMKDYNLIWMAPQLTDQYQLDLQTLKDRGHEVTLLLDEQQEESPDDGKITMSHSPGTVYSIYSNKETVGVKEVAP